MSTDDRLTMALYRLEQDRAREDAMTQPPADAAPALVALIAKWRKAFPSQSAHSRDGYYAGQTLGVNDCANELEAALREGQAAAPAVPTYQEHTCHVMNPPFPYPCRACEVEAGEAALPAQPGEDRIYTQAQLNEACQIASERTLQNVREGRIPCTSPGDAAFRARLEQARQHVDSIEKALRFAFSGSAEHGSFARGNRGEYVPSVFLTLEELRDALAALAGPQEKK